MAGSDNRAGDSSRDETVISPLKNAARKTDKAFEAVLCRYPLCIAQNPIHVTPFALAGLTSRR